METGTYIKIVSGNKKYVGKFGTVLEILPYSNKPNALFHLLVQVGDAELCYRSDEIQVVATPD